MPTKNKTKSERKQWWTIGLFTREGQPFPGHSNFSQVYKSERVLLQDLEHGMKNYYAQRSVYAAMVWIGQVSQDTALHVTPPKFTMYENGQVHVHT